MFSIRIVKSTHDQKEFPTFSQTLCSTDEEKKKKKMKNSDKLSSFDMLLLRTHLQLFYAHWHDAISTVS